MNRLVDIAYDILKNELTTNNVKELDFFDLWKKVIVASNISDEQAKEISGQFFTDLVLDMRFFSTKGIKWSLAELHNYQEKKKSRNEFADDDPSDNTETNDDDDSDTKIEDTISDQNINN